MTNRYVRSTDGNNADTGATWLLAKATIVGADGVDAAGDSIWLSQVHAESTAGAVSTGFAGTKASPTRLLCGNDAAEPPTALATTATVTVTGANNLTLGGNVYGYGIGFTAGSGGASAGSISLLSSGNWQRWESCQFILAATGGTGNLSPHGGSGNAQVCEWINCDLKFGTTGQKIIPSTSGNWHWNGGSILAGSSAVTVFIDQNSTTCKWLIENVNLSNLGTSTNLVQANSGSVGTVIFRNCQLPGSWSGTLLNGTFSNAGRVAMYNCDSAATNYKLWIEDFCGTIRDETTLIRTGGASDGVTGLSWKMTSNANAVYPHEGLYTDEIVLWNDATGSSKTLTIEILHDSATNLKDNEVWVEVDYLGSSSNPKGTLITDGVSVVTTGSDQTASSVTWTTTGMANPNKQSLAVSFTPQTVGYIHARVCLAKASKTIYVDPYITIT